MVAKLDGTNGLLQQYDYQAPSTGFSYTFAAGVNVLVMNPAGTLATGTITMPASPADGMTISFSSTQTITALTVNANTGQSIVRKPTSFGAGSAMTFVYRLSNTTWYPMTNYATAGTVLQVVNANLTTAASTTSTSAVTTGLTATITPTSSTSKILVIVNGFGSHSEVTGSQGLFRMVRNTPSANTVVDNQATSSIGGVTAAIVEGARTRNPVNFSLYDSPATTSAITYTLQFFTSGGGTVYLGRWGTDANFTQSTNLTLMEIAA